MCMYPSRTMKIGACNNLKCLRNGKVTAQDLAALTGLKVDKAKMAIKMVNKKKYQVAKQYFNGGG